MSVRHPVISIVTPVKDGGSLLLETAESLAKQSFRDFEWIVVDDHSGTETKDIIARLPAEFPQMNIRLLLSEQKGACAARNLGLAHANGEWITFLDGDDLYEPEHLQQFMSTVRESVDVILSPWKIRHDDRKAFSQRVVTFPVVSRENLFGEAIAHAGIYHSACLFRKTLVESIAGWDESLAADQDGDFIFRVLLQQPCIAIAEEAYFVYREHSRTSRISKGHGENQLASRLRVIDKMEDALRAKGCLDQYRTNLAQRCDCLARREILHYPSVAKDLLGKAREYDPHYKPVGRWQYQIARKLLGIKGTEQVRNQVEKLIKQ